MKPRIVGRCEHCDAAVTERDVWIVEAGVLIHCPACDRWADAPDVEATVVDLRYRRAPTPARRSPGPS